MECPDADTSGLLREGEWKLSAFSVQREAGQPMRPPTLTCCQPSADSRQLRFRLVGPDLSGPEPSELYLSSNDSKSRPVRTPRDPLQQRQCARRIALGELPVRQSEARRREAHRVALGERLERGVRAQRLVEEQRLMIGLVAGDAHV